MFKLRLLLPSLFAATLSACAISPVVSGSNSDGYKLVDVTPEIISDLHQQKIDANSFGNNTRYQYRIGAGDILYAKLYTPSVQSFDGSNYRMNDNWQEYNEVLVTDDGYATFPYIGDVKLENKTLPEAKQALNKALGRFFKNPQSVLEIKQYYNSKIFVMGEVNKPGMLNIKAGEMSVMEALSSAAGADSLTADYGNIYVIRGALASNNTPEITPQRISMINSHKQLPLSANDLDEEYLVMDEIDAMQPAAPAKQTTSTTKLASAEKPEAETATKDKTKDFLSLETASGTAAPEKKQPALQTTVYEIDGSDGQGIAMAAQFPLQPNDVVYVSPLGITEWSRIITQLIPINAAYLANRGYNH